MKDENLVVDETSEAETMIAGDLGNLMRYLSSVFLLPKECSSGKISLQKLNIILYSNQKARSTLSF